MIFVHERNIDGKIAQTWDAKLGIVNGYKNLRNELIEFKTNVYLPFRAAIMALEFDEMHRANFDTATELINNYYQQLLLFSRSNGVKSQSKLESTFLEEISCYLFKDLPEIRHNIFGVYNHGIYAGLKFDNNRHIVVITKDVDFCIGKKVRLQIEGQETPVDLILPVVAVEVKTYLDKTMLGEVRSSSKDIRSASPCSKAYVLMGHKSLDNEHIIAMRQDSMLTEMFVLKRSERSPMSSTVIYDYWKEIQTAVSTIQEPTVVSVPGRLLNP